MSNRLHESSCESWLIKCLFLAPLLACPSLHLSPLLVDPETLSTAAAPLLPLRLHPRGSGLCCARYEQIFILSVAFSLNKQRAGDGEEVYSPLRNEVFSDFLKAVRVISVRSSNCKQGSGVPNSQNEETRHVQNLPSSNYRK